MPLKKYVNGSWVDSSYRRYETGTDTVTNLPVEILTDGQPVTSWSMKGNTETSGTPSPSNPVTIQGVGNETANLFSSPWEQGSINTSGNNTQSDTTIRTKDYIEVEYNKIYSISRDITGGYINVRFYDAQKQYIGASSASTIELIAGSSISNPMGASAVFCCIKIIDSNIAYMRLNDLSNDLSIHYMMVEGQYTAETMPSYEPIGYKISILKGLSPLTPIYLSQQLLKVGDYSDDVNSSGTATYNVAKYEFTGTERVQKNYSEDPTSYLYYTSMTIAADEVICTQLPYGSSIPKTDVGITGRANNNILYLNFGADVMNAQTSGNTANGLREYLAAQYAAGTPVTVYYVLATPTTETVTAPTIPTTGGTATIDVDTTVKPSEISLTYHGWHSHEPLKRENGQWV